MLHLYYCNILYQNNISQGKKSDLVKEQSIVSARR